MKANTFRIIAFSCAALLLAILIAVPCVVQAFSASLAFYFGKSQLDSATRASGEALATQIVEEGIAMVKNDNNTLPLSKEDVTTDGKQQVNIFGWASTDWLMAGSGSGRSVSTGQSLKPATDLFKALEEYTVFSDDGIAHNPTLTKMYTDFKNGRNSAATNTLHSYDYESCMLYEPGIEKYTTDLKNNAKSYSKVALVVLGRIAGESNDAPKVQYKYNADTDNNRTYLDISTEEEAMLEYVGANFDKVVVLINSTNQMNLEFMDRIDGLDACLVIGGTGDNAANAIPNVLFGLKKVAQTDDDGEEVKDASGNVVYDIKQVSPSGRTIDTYAYDFKTNPTWFYSGSTGISLYSGLTRSDGIYPYDNSTRNGNLVPDGQTGPLYDGVAYLDYVEGIYVGYKWYETADAEGFWSSYGGYDKVVQYPFGYGLSYTEFEWEINNWKVEDGKISVVVDVTNVGDYAGQEVVQLYYTPEYTGKIEKAAVNLCAFAKTEVLLPRSEDPDLCTQRLTLSFEIQDMASYDENNGDGAYVLEKGDYIISLRTDAHNIVDAKDATTTYKVNSDEIYNTYSGSNGTEQIRNLFGTDSSDGVAVDGSDSNQNINWLSRKNSFANFPTAKAATREWQQSLKATNKYSTATANEWDNAWLTENVAPDFSAQGTGDTYKLASLKRNSNGVYVLDYDSETQKYTDAFSEDIYFFGNPENYDASEWDELIDQMSWNELLDLAAHAYIHEQQIISIGKPTTFSLDGPSQIGSFNSGKFGIGYPMATLIAQTWNAQLAQSFGMAVATQALGMDVDGWYAPGINLHRSAFGGRNYEYYSEDSYLSGVMCANTVRGALDIGVYTFIKHIIGYDQESGRDGLYCWMTEQTLRETYLKPFKIAIDAGATGLMTSYGRIGAVWSGGSQALLTDLLRNEWGFKGAVITDYSDHRDFMNGDQMVRAGGDIWMDGWSNAAMVGNGGPGSLGVYGSTTSDAFRYQLRQAAKHTIYMWANAAYEAANSDVGDIQIERAGAKVFAWWWLIVAAVDVLCAAGAGVLIFFGIKKKDKPVAEAVAETPVASSDPTPPPVENTSNTETTETTEAPENE